MSGVAAAAGLGLRRAAGSPGRWAALALAVALATGLLGALTGAGIVAGDHAARRALAGLAAAQRVVRVTEQGPAGARADMRAGRTLARAGAARTVTHGVSLMETRVGRALVQLTAVQPASAWLRVTSGRLPRGRCSAARCEVLAVGGALPAGIVAGRGMRLVVVGRGSLASAVPLGYAAHGPSATSRRASILVAADPGGVDALRGTDSVLRIHNWTAPLAVGGLHAWDTDAAAGRIARVQSALEAQGTSVTLDGPVEALRAARASAADAPRRLRAIGATAAGALLALALLGAAAMRAGMLAEDGRLRRIGATAGQRAIAALAETALPVACGLLCGVALAVVATLLRTRAGHVPAGRVLGDMLAGLPLQLVAVGGAGWAAALLAARLPARAARPVAAAAVLACGALLAGLLVPRAGSGRLPAAAIPVAAVTAGLLVALAVPSLLRGLARVGRPRLALLELARDPGPAAVAAAGLAMAVGVGGFALAYRSTLDRGHDDQARWRVPQAATLTSPIGSPLDGATLAQWRALPGASAALPVIRRDAFAAVGPSGRYVTLLGLAPHAVDAPAVPGAQRGSPGLLLSRGARTISLRARSDVVAAVEAIVRRPGGALQSVEMGTAGPEARTLRAALPVRARGGRLVSITLRPGSGALLSTAHQQAEGGSGGDLPGGRASIASVRAGGRSVSLRGWTAHGAGRGGTAAIGLDFAEESTVVLRAPTPTDHARLAVVVDPGTASELGQRDFSIEYLGMAIPARIARTAPRAPTIHVGDSFVLADVSALRDALDARSPGAGDSGELWLRGSEPGRLARAATAQARRLGLTVTTQAGVRARLASEPRSRELLGALTATALLAALLAAAGVAAAVRSAVRDGGGALFDLEAQGVGPGDLRRGLCVRGMVVGAVGAVAGVALAAVLTLLVTDAVRVGIGGAEPDPPLVVHVPVGWGIAVAAGLVALAVVVAALVAAAALREPLPRPRATSEDAV